ncbi:hypothetical protein [Nocardia carnea]|uniref:hypothetical protein n=1 Tax=Nocardia carnea TaxID=37328 RepID=UPI002456CE81|nr:hypothetical protein [Nocardia carnea]
MTDTTRLPSSPTDRESLPVELVDAAGNAVGSWAGGGGPPPPRTPPPGGGGGGF